MLTPVEDNLWFVHIPTTSGAIRLGMRMTVVRLRNGGLWLHAPVPLDNGLLGALQTLGPVRYIVAPNLMHHRYLAACRRLFPEARILAAPGLASKREDMQFDGMLGQTGELGYGTDLVQHVVAGAPRLNEVAFLHVSTRTLILTDLLFNIHPPANLGTRVYLKLAGKYGAPCQTALLRWFVKDKNAFSASMDHLLNWDFDRIVLSHGQLVASGGRSALRDATAWLRA
jgi:hypothetical protein